MDTVDFVNVNAILTKLYQHQHKYYKLTAFPSAMHNIWHTVYDRPEVYDWLLNQTLAENAEQ